MLVFITIYSSDETSYIDCKGCKVFDAEKTMVIDVPHEQARHRKAA